MKNWKELKKQFWAKLIAMLLGNRQWLCICSDSRGDCALRNCIRVAGQPEHGGKRH